MQCYPEQHLEVRLVAQALTFCLLAGPKDIFWIQPNGSSSWRWPFAGHGTTPELPLGGSLLECARNLILVVCPPTSLFRLVLELRNL
jgi:hypothetical protein